MEEPVVGDCDHPTKRLKIPREMGIRLGNAFQCQKVLYPKHEQEEPSLLCIKQPNSGTSTIKPLPRTDVKKPVPHLDSSGEIFNTVLENAEEPHILFS
jgi:hypothetical protein